MVCLIFLSNDFSVIVVEMVRSHGLRGQPSTQAATHSVVQSDIIVLTTRAWRDARYLCFTKEISLHDARFSTRIRHNALQSIHLPHVPRDDFCSKHERCAVGFMAKLLFIAFTKRSQ